MLSSATPFDVMREHVEALMEVGEPFAAVEHAIDTSGRPEDERAALWLLAWSLGGGGDVRHVTAGKPVLQLARDDGGV